MTIDIEGESKKLSAAVSLYNFSVSQLYRDSDMKTKIFSEEEHARRVEQFAEPVRAAIEQAMKTAAAGQEAAERDALAARADPTLKMSASDLADASARAVFVQEECQRLSLPDLAERVRWAALNGSTPFRFLYARYAMERLERERRTNAQNPMLSPLTAGLRDLRATLQDKEAEKIAAGASAQREAAIRLRMLAAQTRDRMFGRSKRARVTL